MPDAPLWQRAYERWSGDALDRMDDAGRDAVRRIVLACLRGTAPLAAMRAAGWRGADGERVGTRRQARDVAEAVRAAANEVELIRGKR